jgi:hypothetical protein
VRKTIGNFEIDVWANGHPVWVGIKHGSGELKFSHRDLADLEHAVKEAMKAARNSLPEGYKQEV